MMAKRNRKTGPDSTMKKAKGIKDKVSKTMYEIANEFGLELGPTADNKQMKEDRKEHMGKKTRGSKAE